MTLHVERQGAGEPLLLVHGWGMHGGLWGPAVEQLAMRYTVLRVDLPGHGASAPQADYSLDALVDRLATQFTSPLAVCGWSLGGQVALRWAQRAPEIVRKLLLVSSTPRFVQAEGWKCAMAPDVLQAFAASLLENRAQTLKRFLALQVRGGENERELLTVLRAQLFSRGEPEAVALRGGLEILRDSDQRADLSEVVQPTLIIAGARDTLTPAAASEYMAAQMPQARLRVMEGAAHAPFLSHPKIFTDELVKFLDE
ncbi:MAG: pimeloyl-ACP methyl ester esterase BioH [Pseudomonadota bacterium]